MTLALSQSLGRCPSLSDFLYNPVSIGESSRQHSFRTLFGIRSGPGALLTFNSFSSFMTPLTSIVISGILGR